MSLPPEQFVEFAMACLTDAVDNVTIAAEPNPIDHQRNKLLCAIAQSLMGLLAMELDRREVEDEPTS